MKINNLLKKKRGISWKIICLENQISLFQFGQINIIVRVLINDLLKNLLKKLINSNKFKFIQHPDIVNCGDNSGK